MTEVNGISPCSSLAFVGGSDRHGGRRGENGEWNISRAKPGTSQAVCTQRGERTVSRKRSLTNQSFLLIECLILLMMEFIKVLKKRKEFIQFSS